MAEFNPLTVLASAAISVFVSSTVSLLLVPSVAVRQERAKRREQALTRLAAVVAPMLLDLQRYQSRAGGAQREPCTGHGDDAEAAGRVVREATGLGWIRQRLVLRRCRVVFGRQWVDQAALHPGEDEARQRFLGVLFGSIREGGRDVDVTSHAWHKAYSHPPGDRSQRVLSRHLKRLSAGW